MKIILNEMRKIWDIKVIAIIILISVLFYKMFMDFYIEVFPNGHPQTELYNFSVEMADKYGTTLEQDEFESFMAKRVELIKEFETSMANEPIFASENINTYDDYVSFFNTFYEEVQLKKLNGDKEKLQLMEDAKWRLLGEEYDYIGFKLSAIDHVEWKYLDKQKWIDKRIEDDSSTDKEIARYKDIKASEQYNSILYGETIRNTYTYATYFTVLMILSILILLSPLHVKDNLRKVNVLQYTSKRGRKILFSQLIAAITSTFILVTVELLILGGIYSTLGTQIFLNHNLNSFLAVGNTWFDLTYGQWIMLIVVMIYILALLVTCIAFILSKLSRNYITLILKLIPVFTAFIFLALAILDYPFFIYNTIYKYTKIMGIEGIVCVLFASLGIAGYIAISKKHQSIDIL